MKSTKDYDLFKTLKSNRKINTKHVSHLANEFAKQKNAQKRSPIIVNKNMEVIDGQHRLEACKRLNIPVWYIQIDELTIQDAQEINTTKLAWSPKDFAFSYADQGRSDYTFYLDFVDKYKLSYGAALQLLSNSVTFNNLGINFRSGNIHVFNRKVSESNAKRLVEMREAFKALGIDSLERNMALYIIYRQSDPEYSHDLMVQKIKTHGDTIIPTTRFSMFKDQMDDLYSMK
jgi:hypothetical protein